MSILEPRIETTSRDEIRQTQIERLQATLNRAYRHVSFYREVFDRARLLPEDVRSLKDLARLPFTTREDLLRHQPYGMFAVALRDVIRLHPAAGAGGPVVVGYTRNDVTVWSRMAARALTSAGATPEDVIQISVDYGLNAAAMGAQSGAEFLGASVIPSSGFSPERQVAVMRNYRATVLVATPTQALQLGRVVRDLDPASLPLRRAFIIGEVWSDALRREIEESLHVEAFGSYGLTEMTVPGLATECERHEGLHVSEDNVLAEVVNPATGEPLPCGERGELVLTTLTREATPMVRYRTGDLTVLRDAPCSCGRTLVKMEPTHARADDVVIVCGQRVSPAQIRDIVNELVPDAPFRMRVADQEEGQNDLEILVGVDIEQFEDQMRRMQALREQIRDSVFHQLGLRAVVRLVEPGHLRKR